MVPRWAGRPWHPVTSGPLGPGSGGYNPGMPLRETPIPGAGVGPAAGEAIRLVSETTTGARDAATVAAVDR